jgi:hypothetical protein
MARRKVTQAGQPAQFELDTTTLNAVGAGLKPTDGSGYREKCIHEAGLTAPKTTLEDEQFPYHEALIRKLILLMPPAASMCYRHNLLLHRLLSNL